jgi:hypothetical protein
MQNSEWNAVGKMKRVHYHIGKRHNGDIARPAATSLLAQEAEVDLLLQTILSQRPFTTP